MLQTESLPWTALKLADQQIPWLDLRRLADAAAHDAAARRRLMDEMREFLHRYEANGEISIDDFTDFAVPAVFSMSAQQMDESARAEVGRFMLEMFRRAGELDSDMLLEIMVPAGAAFDDALVDPAIEALQREGESLDCFIHLFAALRGVRRPTAARDRLVQMCRQMIEQEEEIGRFSLAIWPARILSGLRDTATLSHLEKMQAESPNVELADIIAEMKSAADCTEWDGLDQWNRHVETWLPNQIQQTRDWAANGNDNDAVEENEVDLLSEPDFDPPTRAKMLADMARLMGQLESERSDEWQDADESDDTGLILPIHRDEPRVGRNELCPCNSGKKYKKCCGKN